MLTLWGQIRLFEKRVCAENDGCLYYSYPCVASAVQHMRNIYYDRLQVQEQDRDNVDVGNRDIADNTDPDIVFDYNARECRNNRIPFQNGEEVDLDDTLLMMTQTLLMKVYI